jgi:diaminohydroxyphosphoribosylaminopyrimidine deaminase/5-amino-6-(5-phosphoribosylamino)uracil reductase
MRKRAKQKPEHERWMRRALVLAAQGEGLTRPNPPVGAVVVKNNRKLAEGYHKKAGGAHAERAALRKAGTRARGATLYVTLEPCSSWGRTGPCTEAIIEAGVKTVVIATRDPNPANRGKGVVVLKKRGVQVIENVLSVEALRLIAPFTQWIRTGRPYVTLKLGMTLDGKIADRNRRSQWITGAASRETVQRMRRRADAIMVGAGTVREDDPSLWPRPAYGRKPLRVIVDDTGQVPRAARLLSDKHAARTLIVTTRACEAATRKAYRRHGAQTVTLDAVSGRLPLSAVLQELGRRDVLHVLCEGGGDLAAGLVAEGLVDEYVFFYAPSFLGGNGPLEALTGANWLLDDRPRLRLGRVEQLGSDFMVIAKPAKEPSGKQRRKTKEAN